MAPQPSTPKFISRNEAKRQGLQRFYTGKPCVKGHDSERYVSSFGCVRCSCTYVRSVHQTKNVELGNTPHVGGPSNYSNLNPAYHDRWFAAVNALRSGLRLHFGSCATARRAEPLAERTLLFAAPTYPQKVKA